MKAKRYALRHWVRLGCWAAAFVLAPACEANSSVTSTQAAARAVSEVNRHWNLEFSGCSLSDSGKRCALSEGAELIFWSESKQALTAHSEQVALTWRASTPYDTGVQYRLDVPRGVRELEIRGGTERRRLEIVYATEPPALLQARALRARGELDAARAKLASLGSTPASDTYWRVRALSARLALDGGHHEEAAEGLRQGMDVALREGRTTDAVVESVALSFVLVSRLRRYDDARAVLARAAQAAEDDPAGRARLPHYQGMLELEVGQLGSAVVMFEEAAQRLARIGLRDHELIAREKLAYTYALLGRLELALAEQRRVAEEVSVNEPCDRADRFETLLWIALLAEPAPGSATATLAEHARAEGERSLDRCPAPRKHRNHAINAALLALQLGDRVAAAARIKTLENLTGGEDTLLATWTAEVFGRQLLATNRPADARVAFSRALALSRIGGLVENELLAQLGLGRSEQALERWPQALKAFEAAEQVQGELLRGVPVGLGAAGFLSQREAGTRALVELLVHSGQPDRALEVARRARARILTMSARGLRIRSLDAEKRARWEAAIVRYRSHRALAEQRARDVWKFAADRLAREQRALDADQRAAREALRETWTLLQDVEGALDNTFAPLNAGEGLVAYFPGQARGLGFWADVRGTRVISLPESETNAASKEWIDRLLLSMTAELAHIERLRIIVPSTWSTRDVHSEAFDGLPILQRFAIAYGTDVGAVHVASEPLAAEQVLLVDNPTGDLPSAQLEGDRVSARLAARAIVRLTRDRALRGALLDVLPRSRLMHYAGHGFFAGVDGIDGGLRLADGDLLVSDVLMLPRVPALLVLSACEGAREQPLGLAAGLGLAQAFIARGAHAVVAATRPVRDDVSARLIDAFYAALETQTAGDPVRALQLAQLQMQQRGIAVDWAAFRVLVP